MEILLKVLARSISGRTAKEVSRRKLPLSPRGLDAGLSAETSLERALFPSRLSEVAVAGGVGMVVMARLPRLGGLGVEGVVGRRVLAVVRGGAVASGDAGSGSACGSSP